MTLDSVGCKPGSDPSLETERATIDKESEGRLSGKLIKGGIRMELSCSHRVLERIVGDFLSQWVADSFLTVAPLCKEKLLAAPNIKAEKGSCLVEAGSARAWCAQPLREALQTSSVPWAHTECYPSKPINSSTGDVIKDRASVTHVFLYYLIFVIRRMCNSSVVYY